MQSTKACSGDPYSPDYFTLQDTTGYYYSRRRTLFNIYAFAEHTTIRNATPELVIENSQFEYFLANGYESLITIETYTLNQVIVLEKTYAEGQSGSTNNDNTRTYYNSNGADRGAKITITNSIFKHSRFCKGMIVYRPSLYVSSEDFRTIVNQTNLYMN